IQEDADGWLWLGTLNGICGFDPSRLPDPAPPIWLGIADGLKSSTCTAMRAARDAGGRLYFGTAQGFSVIDPARAKAPPALPRPVVEGLVAEKDGEPVTRDPTGELPPGSRFEISFTGLGPELADDMQF